MLLEVLIDKEHEISSLPPFKINIHRDMPGNFIAIWKQKPWNVVILFILP